MWSVFFYDNGQNFKMVVRTSKKGNVQNQISKLAQDIAKEYGLTVEVIANHPRNFKSVQNIINNQGDRIARQYPSLQLIGYDPKNDAIALSFYEPNENQREKIKSQFSKLSGMNTVIKFLDNPIHPTSVIGGGALEYSSMQQFNCTAGFTGVMNGQLGFLTATHCVTGKKPPINYINSFGKKYALGQPIIDKSIYHEISFVPVKNATIVGEVYRYLDGKGADQYRSNLKITGVGVIQQKDVYTANNVGGLQLCHIGQTTGYSCGMVVAVNVGGGGCNASIHDFNRNHRVCATTFVNVAGSGLRVLRGDSGGPFFDASGKAYGIASAGEGNSHLMSPISHMVQSGFNIKVGR